MKKLVLLFVFGLLASPSVAQIRYTPLFNSTPSVIDYFQSNSDNEIVQIGQNRMVFYSEKDKRGWEYASTILINKKSLRHFNGKGNTIIILAEESDKYELLRSIDAGKTWESVLIGAVKYPYDEFSSTQVFTEQKFLVCGKANDKRMLKKTEDAGATWTNLGTPAGNDVIVSVFFINDLEGFVKDKKSKYFKTVDGGTNWTEITTFPSNTSFFQFSSIDKGIAIAQRTLYVTSDGGATWTSRLINTTSAQVVKGDTLIANVGTTFYYSADHFVTKTEKTFDQGESPENIKVINDSTFIGKSNSSYLKTTDRGQNWTSINDIGTSSFKPSAFSWVNDSLGYAFSSDSVYKTTSGGFSWKVVGKHNILGIAENLISFGDNDHGVVVPSTGNYVYRTENGGKSWFQSTHAFEQNSLRGLKMISNSKGWLIRDAGAMEQTLDNGKTWTSIKSKLPTELKSAFVSIDFLSETHGIIGNATGWVAITTDGGSTWTPKQISSSNFIDLVHFFSEQEIIALYYGGIFRSEDGGANWNKISASTILGKNENLDPSTWSFLNDKVGVILSYRSILYTIDAGKTWTSEPSPTNAYSSGLHLNADGTGVFYNDVFTKFESDVLATSVEEKAPQIKSDYKLAQNYPNPFNPSTTISFTLKQFDSVSLSVYSIDGRLVSNLISYKNLSSGAHEVVFDAKSLASGVYFYQLKTSQGVLTQKMTLIK